MGPETLCPFGSIFNLPVTKIFVISTSYECVGMSHPLQRMDG